MEGLRLLSIHAHPDDESSKGAATVAKYSDAGAEAVLICATGGEEGEILNEAVNTPEVLADLFQVRMRELKAATDIIGYSTVEMLGYRDSGMKGSDAKKTRTSAAVAQGSPMGSKTKSTMETSATSVQIRMVIPATRPRAG